MFQYIRFSFHDYRLCKNLYRDAYCLSSSYCFIITIGSEYTNTKQVMPNVTNSDFFQPMSVIDEILHSNMESVSDAFIIIPPCSCDDQLLSLTRNLSFKCRITSNWKELWLNFARKTSYELNVRVFIVDGLP